MLPTKDIHDFAIKALDDEVSRSYQIDEKCSTYITLVSLLLGGLGFSWNLIFEKIISHDKSANNLSIVLGCFLFISLVVTLIFLGICLMQKSIRHLRTKYDSFYQIAITHDQDYYHLAIAQAAKEPIKEAIAIVNKKANWLYRIHLMLALNFAILILLVVVLSWKFYEITKSEPAKKNIDISISTKFGNFRIKGGLDMSTLQTIQPITVEEGLNKTETVTVKPDTVPKPSTPETEKVEQTGPLIIPPLIELDPLPVGNEHISKDISFKKSMEK